MGARRLHGVRDAGRFYEKASARSKDAGIRQLLDDLALEERAHRERAEELGKDKLTNTAVQEESETNRRLFVLQVVQPGLAGLMDGSVSTLAPVFAAAVATHKSWDAFLVGLAASIGAGISMGFAEALSDDGSFDGSRPSVGARADLRRDDDTRRHRPHAAVPAARLSGGDDGGAIVVVLVELGVIHRWIRNRYMDTSPVSAVLQVGLGGVMVFLTGILIGSS